MTISIGHLRHRFMTELETCGWLTPSWREAFATVPRHAFLPRFFRQTLDGTKYEAVDIHDLDALEVIYRNTVLPTQLDGDNTRWEQARENGPIDGVPTCSATQQASWRSC
jgi:protein-L-isoaspartate(D-aspartate) O-methyltransferase